MQTLRPRNSRLEFAKLERLRRQTLEPLYPMYDFTMTAATIFILGFVRFHFYDASQGFSVLTLSHLFLTVAAMAFVPFLIGAVLTLEIFRYRFKTSIEECLTSCR